MFFSENNRLSKPHFDWPLLVTSYLLALYGVLAITIANFNPSPRLRPLFAGSDYGCEQRPSSVDVGCGEHGGCGDHHVDQL
ncbi:MAG: hypothetical protein ACLVB5_04175 [Christensenellales bacterium]